MGFKIKWNAQGLKNLEREVTDSLRNKWAPAMSREAHRLVGQSESAIRSGLDRVSRSHGVTPSSDELRNWAKSIANGTAISFVVK